jgi:hypothetical protein
VTTEEEIEFTRLIDNILATADLQTVTRKKIRQGLEAAVGKNLSEQKVSFMPVNTHIAAYCTACVVYL